MSRRPFTFVCVSFLLACAVISAYAHDEDQPHYINGEHNPEHKHTKGEEDEHRTDFDQFDSNKDGLIDAQEVRVAIPSIPQEELAEFFSIADKDQSGSVDFPEYLSAALLYDS
eukprot:GILK01011550.1.p1 GENE.GILK01011550.1~~GILK01011550.1.p1  ORF type:complete len:113 (-),score=22.10 GILK01011550.1:193-531(-)